MKSDLNGRVFRLVAVCLAALCVFAMCDTVSAQCQNGVCQLVPGYGSPAPMISTQGQVISNGVPLVANAGWHSRIESPGIPSPSCHGPGCSVGRPVIVQAACRPVCGPSGCAPGYGLGCHPVPVCAPHFVGCHPGAYRRTGSVGIGISWSSGRYWR